MESKLDIKKLIKERGTMGKYHGVAPEGFVLVHEKTLEDLKNWFIWEEWKSGKISLEKLNNNNLDNT
jgi:hypothetical protein